MTGSSVEPAASEELALLSACARAVLPAGVVFEVARVDSCAPGLFPEEECSVRRASVKRRAEFNAGRVCARRVLKALGLKVTPLPMANDRAPSWPGGVSGSLSHDGEYCVAAAGIRGRIDRLGVDVMQRNRFNLGLADVVCTRGERRRLSSGPPQGTGADSFEILFSVKESIYKCLSADSGRAFDFKEIDVDLAPSGEGGRISIDGLGSALARRAAAVRFGYGVTPDYVFTCAWL